MFSYGNNNYIDLNEHKIIQLVGKNGDGKSSIALILEEVLSNKNSKNIKKTNILNRYVKDNNYQASLTFSKDQDEYEVYIKRGTTQTVKLIKNGVDISSHTATQTLKTLESIIGPNISPLIYQSSKSSLEFLTATDTNRKKFLIELLDLTKYTDAFEVFKSACKIVSDELKIVETKIHTINSWISTNSIEKEEKLEPLPPVDPPTELQQELATISTAVAGYIETNKRITKNNQYKVILSKIPIENIGKAPAQVDSPKPLEQEKSEIKGKVLTYKETINKLKKLPDNCPMCLQQVDKSIVNKIVTETTEAISLLESQVVKLDDKIKELNLLNVEQESIVKNQNDWELYHSLVDKNLPENLLDAQELETKRKELQEQISEQLKKIAEVNSKNTKIHQHNIKIDLILSQKQKMLEDLAELNLILSALSKRIVNLQILQKTFSTNGIVAYKIECMIKDLEELSNKYLGELSAGRFQISFKVSGSDKLNVIITDNGHDIDMSALSSGETARVNTATLLAVRKLLHSLSSSKVNVLILDETMETLDLEGKEKLIEILLEEHHLNTILVSHGYTHPLLEKVHVIRENNITRIEHYGRQ